MTTPRWSRRTWLRTTGASALGLALGGCSAALPDTSAAPYPRPLARGPFRPPRVSDDRVVRTVVGLRPYRSSGFVVRAESLANKLLVHNYGHGGGGVTLSWGSAHLAVREASDVLVRRAAVLGCGVLGLSTARLLQDRGWSVTIYARELPPHTTSNVAGALWGPTSVFDAGRATPEFERQFAEAARVSHHAFQNLVGGGYGVRWIEQYYLADAEMALPYYIRTLPDLYPGMRDLEPGEHPFPARYVRRIETMMIEPGVYLRRLVDDVRQAGGQVLVRGFTHVSEVLALPEPVLFNCTGLGAGSLFGDRELVPIKGQTSFLPPDPAVDFATIGGGTGSLYMFPRSDGILLGGTFERGDATLEPDPAETRRIVRGHRELFARMG